MLRAFRLFSFSIDNPTEPGGYLQWDEVDSSSFQSLLLNSKATNAASSRLVQYELQHLQNCGIQVEYVLFLATKKQRVALFHIPSVCCFPVSIPYFETIGRTNKRSSWVKHLREYFSSSSELELVTGFRLPDSNVSRKLETDDHLMAAEDVLLAIATHVARAEERTVLDVRDALKKLLESAIEEAGKGVALQMDWYTCVGRKL